MGAQRVKSHELSWEDIDALRAAEEEATERLVTSEELTELGNKALRLVQEEGEDGRQQ